MPSEVTYLSRLPLAGSLIASDFVGWTPELLRELSENDLNPRVGQKLLIENDRLRVWSINLAPGERVPFHRHVLDYFWTAITNGSSSQHTHDGTTREVAYAAGETRYFEFAAGEFLVHDLENSGAATLSFITVELLESANRPLPLMGRTGRGGGDE